MDGCTGRRQERTREKQREEEEVERSGLNRNGEEEETWADGREAAEKGGRSTYVEGGDDDKSRLEIEARVCAAGRSYPGFFTTASFFEPELFPQDCVKYTYYPQMERMPVVCHGSLFHSFDALLAPVLWWSPSEISLASGLDETKRPTSKWLSPRQCVE